tara:strand:- start:1890 stop:2387 length:498 start_codon:yes stop_codon:yes gene_type:complete
MVSHSKIIILDLETTGLNPRKDSIIEIFAGRYSRGEIVEEFETLLKPRRHISPFITSLTGLTQTDVEEAPMFKEISSELYSFLRGNRIIAYNSSFDKRFLVANDRKFGCLRFVDYLRYVKKKRPNLRSYTLESVSRHFGFSSHSKLHRARTDVETLAKLIRNLGC